MKMLDFFARLFRLREKEYILFQGARGLFF